MFSLLAYSDVNASLFVLVGKNATLKGFDNFINAVILVAGLSIDMASSYAGSRTLTALCQLGDGPKLFTYIDRAGRPLAS